MAKKLIQRYLQRYLPEPKTITNNRYLRFLGSALYNTSLWHLNRRSAATAFFIGIFVAFIPMPFQMVLAATLAVLVRCNLPLAVALVWITNPLTMPAIFFFTYKVGCVLLQTPVPDAAFELSFHALGNSFSRIWKPLYLGSIVSGLFFGFISYLVIRMLWRWNVTSSWQQRRKKWRSKPSTKSPD